MTKRTRVRNLNRCRDHKGQIFPSQSEMARHYGIRPKLYFKRRAAGYSIEASLTGVGVRSMSTPCEDHKGNQFVSVNEMCRHYGIGSTTFFERLKYGHTLEEALTMPVKDNVPYTAPRQSTDHKGNVFVSEKEMCRHYGVDRTTYKNRRLRGMSIEQALTAASQRGKSGPHISCIDHLGISYPSIKAMCRAHGVCVRTYRDRIRRGYSVEEALTTEAYMLPASEVDEMM